MASKVVSTRLDERIVAEVDRIAKEIGHNRTYVIASILHQGIQNEPNFFKLLREAKAKRDGR